MENSLFRCTSGDGAYLFRHTSPVGDDGGGGDGGDSFGGDGSDGGDGGDDGLVMEPTFLGILAPLAPPIERLDRGFRS